MATKLELSPEHEARLREQALNMAMGVRKPDDSQEQILTAAEAYFQFLTGQK